MLLPNEFSVNEKINFFFKRFQWHLKLNSRYANGLKIMQLPKKWVIQLPQVWISSHLRFIWDSWLLTLTRKRRGNRRCGERDNDYFRVSFKTTSFFYSCVNACMIKFIKIRCLEHRDSSSKICWHMFSNLHKIVTHPLFFRTHLSISSHSSKGNMLVKSSMDFSVPLNEGTIYIKVTMFRL